MPRPEKPAAPGVTRTTEGGDEVGTLHQRPDVQQWVIDPGQGVTVEISQRGNIIAKQDDNWLVLTPHEARQLSGILNRAARVARAFRHAEGEN